MTENTRTPGQWVIVDGSSSGHCCFGPSIVAHVDGEKDYEHTVVCEMLSGTDADARAIAAAYPLLDALKGLLAEFVGDVDPATWDDGSAVSAACKAIAIAEQGVK